MSQVPSEKRPATVTKSVEPIPYRAAESGRYFSTEVVRWKKLVNEGKAARLQQ